MKCYTGLGMWSYMLGPGSSLPGTLSMTRKFDPTIAVRGGKLRVVLLSLTWLELDSHNHSPWVLAPEDRRVAQDRVVSLTLAREESQDEILSIVCMNRTCFTTRGKCGGDRVDTAPNKRLELDHDLPIRPFRFLDLPYDIRHRIYCFCPITGRIISLESVPSRWTSHEIRLCRKAIHRFKYDSRPFSPAYFKSELHDVVLRQRRRHSYCKDDDLYEDQPVLRIDMNILNVCRTIYEETIRVFYTYNTFQFLSRDGWRNFIILYLRLTPTRRGCVRMLEFEFSGMKRLFKIPTQPISPWSDMVKFAMDCIPRLPKLNTLQIFLASSTRLSYSDVIDYINIRKGSNKVVLSVATKSKLALKAPKNDHKSRIPSHIIQKLLAWGWDVRDDFELNRDRCLDYALSSDPGREREIWRIRKERNSPYCMFEDSDELDGFYDSVADY